MKFGGVLVLVCLTIFANAGRKFCREADQKLEDLANKIEELDCSDLGSTGSKLLRFSFFFLYAQPSSSLNRSLEIVYAFNICV